MEIQNSSSVPVVPDDASVVVPEVFSRKKFSIGLLVAFGVFLCSAFIMVVVGVMLAASGLGVALLALSVVVAASPVIGGLLFSLPSIIVFVILNRISALFSKNISYRKGLLWGLLLSFIFVFQSLHGSNQISQNVQNALIVGDSHQSSDVNDCMAIKKADNLTPVDMATCLKNVAINKKDPMICDSIEASEEFTMSIKSDCYLRTALSSLNPAACQKISSLYNTQSDMDKCFGGIAVDARKPSLCHGIKGVDERAGCYYYAVKAIGDPLLYKRFCPFVSISQNKNFDYVQRCIELGGPDAVATNDEFRNEVTNLQRNFDQASAELSK